MVRNIDRDTDVAASYSTTTAGASVKKGTGTFPMSLHPSTPADSTRDSFRGTAGFDATGDQNMMPSWDELVAEHADRVYRLAYRLSGNIAYAQVLVDGAGNIRADLMRWRS